MLFCSRTRAGLLSVCLLAIIACTDSPAPNAIEPSKATGATEPTEPVDLSIPELKAPPMAETYTATAEDSGTATLLSQSAPTATTNTMSANPTPLTALTAANKDVGYEGLTQAVNAMEQLAQPILINADVKLSPEVTNQLITQSRDYMKQVQKASSVDKELRYELWERAIDINAALTELKDSSPGPRYEQLRSILSEQIEQSQGQLLSGSRAP